MLGPIDLAFRRGELTFLVGGNGSGKTTLAKLLCGLYAPEGGEIRLNNEPVTDKTRDAYRQLFSLSFPISTCSRVCSGSTCAGLIAGRKSTSNNSSFSTK